MSELIDFKEINNFWIVYLMPFDPKDRNNPFVKEYQEFCKDKGILGMGWNDEASLAEFEKVLSGEEVEDFSKIKAFKNYNKISPNDLVMMRLKNGRYYIGKVREKAKRSNGEDILENNNNELNTGRLSYFCEVDKWYEYSEFELPGDIVGRFSQRRHSTIQCIGGTNPRIKDFMYSLYKQKFSEENNIENFEIPKIELDKKNFTEALNYMDLEDLVYMYILEKYKKDNRTLLLFPSECKISKTRYEFDLIDLDKPNEKRITCQVKNKEEVDYEEYLNDASSNEYEKIFLFSGIGAYGKNINEEKAIEQIKNKNLNEKLEIIKKSDLYDFFMNDEIMWKREKIYKFYQKKN